MATRKWEGGSAGSIVCAHGVGQHGGVFAGLGERLAARGHSVYAVDLRGHGDSGREPPWDTATLAGDLLETADALGIERATWIGHSFGGRVAAALAARAGERVERLALLDPGLGIPADHALRSAEIERLDWSFATVEGAVNALLSSDTVVAAPREVVTAFVRDDLRKGPDGRFRFSFSPAAVVVAWSEMVLPVPLAELPTLLVRAETPLFDLAPGMSQYRETLGELLTEVTVPNGHNVLWEAPEQTIGAVESFLNRAPGDAAS